MEKTENIKKYKNIFIPLLLTGIIIFTGIIFFRPRIIEILRIRREISKEKERLVKLTQKEAFLENLDEYELTKKTHFLLKLLPPEQDVIIYFSTIKALVSQSNLQLREIQVNLGGEKGLNANLSSIDFTTKIVGNKDDMNSFIEKIRTTYPLMKIGDLNFSLEEGLLQAGLNFKAFFLSLPKEIGIIENPLPLITSPEEKIYQEVSKFTSPLSESATPYIQVGKENPFAL